MNKKDLTQGSVVRSLVRLTLPMMLSIISMVAFNLIDTYFIGKLGERELAALTFTFPVIMVVFSIIQGLGIGATALIARSIGKGDRKKAARETTDSIALTLLLTGFFVLVGLLTLEPTMRLLGADGEAAAMSAEYMRIWYFALFFVSVPFVGNSAIRATGDASTPTYIMLFAVIVNGIHDSEVLGDLLAETDASVEQVSGNGAYDTRHCYSQSSLVSDALYQFPEI